MKDPESVPTDQSFPAAASPVVLVIEDDRGLRESLAMVLDFRDLEVVEAGTGEHGIELVEQRHPDAIVLDINLPGIDGLEVCRRIRDLGYRGPVLMLTARQTINERVAGLDAGADDYLAKPFALEELLARIRAMLRRSTEAPVARSVDELVLDDLVVSPVSRMVQRGGRTIEVTKIEFDLLHLLVANARIVLSRDTIYERIWGYDAELASNTLEVFVSALRKKIEVDEGARLIHTVRGVGYVARLV
jgi:two-component system response regulator MprA